MSIREPVRRASRILDPRIAALYGIEIRPGDTAEVQFARMLDAYRNAEPERYVEYLNRNVRPEEVDDTLNQDILVVLARNERHFAERLANAPPAEYDLILRKKELRRRWLIDKRLNLPPDEARARKEANDKERTAIKYELWSVRYYPKIAARRDAALTRKQAAVLAAYRKRRRENDKRRSIEVITETVARRLAEAHAMKPSQIRKMMRTVDAASFIRRAIAKRMEDSGEKMIATHEFDSIDWLATAAVDFLLFRDDAVVALGVRPRNYPNERRRAEPPEITN